MSKTLCPVCGGRLILHKVGSYADDYAVGTMGSVNQKRLKRTIYQVDWDLSTVYCRDCGETYTDFEIDQNKHLKLS